MPDWVPWHNTLIYCQWRTGNTCMAFCLLFGVTRRLASMLIISLLIAVFPANVQMAIDYYLDQNPYFICCVAAVAIASLYLFTGHICMQRKMIISKGMITWLMKLQFHQGLTRISAAFFQLPALAYNLFLLFRALRNGIHRRNV